MLRHLVNKPIPSALEVFNAIFIFGWVDIDSGILENGNTVEDDFGMYMMGDEL